MTTCLRREARSVHFGLLLDGSTLSTVVSVNRITVYDHAESDFICLLHQSGDIGAKYSWANCTMMGDVMPTTVVVNADCALQHLSVGRSRDFCRL